MSSLIEGYNYDIFISYRQKDNKGDHWVSEFVEALKTELESTFKEEISVYFDINPHDGLLETHDVDASLKEKLKCLIFIPIISRTYCDPKSFAWEHEFKAFVEMASKDQFGLKVMLKNGNFTSRVLPVQIHEITTGDKKIIEGVLGGILRAVDFVYREPGVNRPLRSFEDHPDNNLNKTVYRNQINKVANAIDEIIEGIKNVHRAPGEKTDLTPVKLKDANKKEISLNQGLSYSLKKRRLLQGSVILGILLFSTGIFLYRGIFKHNTIERLRSSGKKITVAIMPFQNMTNDTTWNVWQDGIQEIVTSSLSNSDELKVIQTQSLKSLIQFKDLKNYASITPSVAGSISQKINADVFIYGKILKSGGAIRLYAGLIDSKTGEVLKSMQVEGEAGRILHLGDSLSGTLKNYFLIAKLEKQNTEFKELTATNSPDAYKYYILGKNAYFSSDPQNAIIWMNQACAIDSNFTWAMFWLSVTYQDAGLFQEARKWDLRLYRKKDMLPLTERLWACFKHAEFCELEEAIRYLNQLKEIDDQFPLIYLSTGWTYIRLHQYEKAIPEYEKALEIYKSWGSKPLWVSSYTELGFAYHNTHKYKEEHELYKKGELEFPEDPDLIRVEAILIFSEGDTVSAERLIEEYKSVCKDKSYSEVRIKRNLAKIYSQAGITIKAEKYYREALSIEPGNAEWMNNLAYFLIDKNLNVGEGMQLISKALEISPLNSDYLATKGWGLYKQGKIKAALDLLEKSWNNKLFYRHEHYLHLLEARKALANQ